MSEYTQTHTLNIEAPREQVWQQALSRFMGDVATTRLGIRPPGRLDLGTELHGSFHLMHWDLIVLATVVEYEENCRALVVLDTKKSHLSCKPNSASLEITASDIPDYSIGTRLSSTARIDHTLKSGLVSSVPLGLFISKSMDHGMNRLKQEVEEGRYPLAS